MNAYIMVIAVLLPVLGGVLIPFLPFRKRNVMAFYIELIVINILKARSHVFGTGLMPDYYPCGAARLVSCYALFK